MGRGIEAIVTVITAVIAVAIVAVIFGSSNSSTVIKSATGGFASILKTALSPATGSGSLGSLTNTSTTLPFFGQ